MSLPMLTTLEAWKMLSDVNRLAVAKGLAAALGPEFSAVAVLRGSEKLAAVLHGPSQTELVAIPGGTFVAGLRPEELELMKTIEYQEDTAVDWLDEISVTSPPREVTIKPFLCARAPLLQGRARELGTDEGWVVGNEASPNAAIRFDEEQTEPLIDQYPETWRLPTTDEWEWVARSGGVTPFINGSTFEQAEEACKAIDGAAYDAERFDAGQNGFGVWGMPWGDWIAEPDDPRAAIAGRGGAAMLYPWQSDEIIMQLAGGGDDLCGFEQQCLRFVLDLPADA